MSLIQPTRRGLIGALIAGPAIVRVASIMPVRALLPEDPMSLQVVTYDDQQYFLIMHKGEDGLVRTARLRLL